MTIEDAPWEIGALTQEEYEALFMALTYFTDHETLGCPDENAPPELVSTATDLLRRLRLPSGD